MSERTPTLAEIGSALRVKMAETVGYYINLSYPKDSLSRENEALDLAQKLMTAFRLKELPAGSCWVNTDEPYTTNVGATPDGRVSILVTVRWWTWTGGDEGE